MSSYTNLSNEVDVLSGFAWKAAHFNRDRVGLPIIRIQNVGNDSEKDFVFWPGEYKERFVVRKGDVLLTLSGSFRLAEWQDEDALLNQRIVKLTPSNDLDKRYFIRFMETQLKKIESMGRHALVNNVSVTDIKNFQIPVPPLEEQKRIAKILDAADALRAKRRESLAQLDALLQSTFLDLFGDPFENPKGWPRTLVENEIDFLTSGSRGWAKYYSDDGALFIRIQNLKSGRLDFTDMAFVTPPESAEAKRTRVKPGDVLLSITADLGRTAVVPYGVPVAHINQHLAILRFKTMNPTFVAYQLATQGGVMQFQRLNREGVKAGLNFKDVNSVKLIKPPQALQEKFSKIVEEIEEQKKRLIRHSSSLNDLFASIQDKAFSGEL